MYNLNICRLIKFNIVHEKKLTLQKILFFSLFFVTISMTAQTVKGLVVDENKEPLPFFNVLEKGTTNGVTTDDKGEFSLM